MPKFLIQANYVGDGVKGLLKEGGTNRRANTEMLTKSMGGTMEALYFAFGGGDVFVIADLPDSISMSGHCPGDWRKWSRCRENNRFNHPGRGGPGGEEGAQLSPSRTVRKFNLIYQL